MASLDTIHETQYQLGERLRLWAFICSHTCVKRMDGDPPPTATFAQIYQQRPPDCRYAILSRWDLVNHFDCYYAVDLFEVKRDLNTNELITPPSRLRHDDLDAIIMATVLLYNKEPKRGR